MPNHERAPAEQVTRAVVIDGEEDDVFDEERPPTQRRLPREDVKLDFIIHILISLRVYSFFQRMFQDWIQNLGHQMKKLWPIKKSKLRRTQSTITSPPSREHRCLSPFIQHAARPSLPVEETQRNRAVKQHNRSLRSQPARTSMSVEEPQQVHRHEQGRLSSKRDRLPSNNDPLPRRQQPVKTPRKSAEQRPRPSIDSPVKQMLQSQPVQSSRTAIQQRPRPSTASPVQFPRFQAEMEEKARKKAAYREMLCREAYARQQDINESMEIEMARRAEYEEWNRQRRYEEEQQGLEDSYEHYMREQERQEREHQILHGKLNKICIFTHLCSQMKKSAELLLIKKIDQWRILLIMVSFNKVIFIFSLSNTEEEDDAEQQDEHQLSSEFAEEQRQQLNESYAQHSRGKFIVKILKTKNFLKCSTHSAA